MFGVGDSLFPEAAFKQIIRIAIANNIMSARLLIKPEEPHPAKAMLCLPSSQAGRGWGWGAMTVEIITNYTDMI
ncbi:hypothetical protein [Nostoc sp.]|uniref:hypothetical protein n=1 Tax=Nostoc sp. TaxID=1180 RepID=UPI002FFB2F88